MTYRNRVLAIEYHDARSLEPHPGNWRNHGKAQADALKGVLAEVGIAGAILAYRSERNGGKLTVIDGHLRRDAAPQQWPVLVLDVDDAEADYILATHDPLAAMADAGAAALDALLASVNSGEAAVQAMLAQVAEDAGLYPDKKPELADVEPQVDRAEELRAKWGVEPGQLWQLGDHRLICGDCTDAAVVARVMGGEKADAVVTDPPYGVGVDYDGFDDSLSNVQKLIKGFFPLAEKMGPMALTPGVPAMWDYPRPAWVGAWVHPASNSSGPWGFVGANPILYYGKDPYQASGKGRRDSSFVAVADRKGEGDHPVAKPLNVWMWLVERMTPIANAIVYEPFSGSGTTIMACEALGRKCRAVEISPAYVAVALERWSAATGKTPVQVQP